MLTGQELTCLYGAAYGLNNRQIASVLGIGYTTVRTYMHRIFIELNTDNRTKAVLEGIKSGYINLNELGGRYVKESYRM